MTSSVLALDAVEGEISDRHQAVKRYAVERLLDWGFAPAEIARILDCGLHWIAEINDHRPHERI